MSVDLPSRQHAGTSWEELLDDLERDLADAERLVATGATGAGPAYGTDGTAETTVPTYWSAPVSPGPVPGHLVPRARDLARRQHDLRSRLAASLERLGQVQRLADDSDGDRRPRFVDVVG